MQCPVDGTALAMSDRQGVEIDYCPKCRGVWLDRGELDKLIERSSEFEGSQRGPAPQQREQHFEQPRYEERREHRYDENDNRHYDKNDHQGHHKKKKEGFLGDLFDF